MADYIKELVKHRIEKATEELKNAKILIANNSFTKSLNCSYYAIFHITRALLSIDKYDSKKHSGIISLFISNYVKTGIIDEKFREILINAQELRKNSDYHDFFVTSKEEAIQQLEDANHYISKILTVIDSKLKDLST